MKSAIRKHRYDVLDRYTGELKGSYAQFEREQKSQKSANAYKWAKHGDKFTFARMEAIKDIIGALTTSQCGLFLVLQTYSDYEGILRNTALLKKNKTVMTNQDIMNVLGISKQTFSDFINKCLNNNIIIKKDDESYMLNSKYHFRGKKKEGDKVTKIYNTEIRNMQDKVSYADLGLLYRLIPHINFITNTICANPYETDPKIIQKLNQKQICELLGISNNTFYRLLNMEYDGKVVFAQVTVKRKKSYLVNPWVFYRLEMKPNDTLIEQEVNSFKPDKTLLSIFNME